MIRKEELNLVTEWDKTFKKSDKVDHSKVTFVNRYGGHSVQLKSSAQVFMLRQWQREDS